MIHAHALKLWGNAHTHKSNADQADITLLSTPEQGNRDDVLSQATLPHALE